MFYGKNKKKCISLFTPVLLYKSGVQGEINHTEMYPDVPFLLEAYEFHSPYHLACILLHVFFLSNFKVYRKSDKKLIQSEIMK